MYCNRALNNQITEQVWPTNFQSFEFDHNKSIKPSSCNSYYARIYKSDDNFLSSTSSCTSFSNGSNFKSKLSPANSFNSVNTNDTHDSITKPSLPTHNKTHTKSNKNNSTGSPYIQLIGKALLTAPNYKMILSEIYDHIVLQYSEANAQLPQGNGWRSSIRHNLSLNDCFIKAGKSPTGKGNYWTIQPDFIEYFSKGIFCRRLNKIKPLKLHSYSSNTLNNLNQPNLKNNHFNTPCFNQSKFNDKHNFSFVNDEKIYSKGMNDFSKDIPIPTSNLNKTKKRFDIDFILK